jgi:hypothetical protein
MVVVGMWLRCAQPGPRLSVLGGAYGHAVSWREFIVGLVDAIAWPAMIGLGVLLMRHQIPALLEGPVRRWKAGPIEFEYEWAQATEQVGKAGPALLNRATQARPFFVAL